MEEQLVLGSGWVRLLETGQREPTLGTLAAILNVYGTDLSDFFKDLDFGEEGIIADRHLSADESGTDLILHFPMGKFAAAVRIENASLDEYNTVLLILRNGLAGGDKRQAIVDCFLEAAALWPRVNPSDLWYFFVAHAYQDGFNHPASDAGKDWSQSWKRAGGWSLEAIFVRHYNPFLKQHGIELVMPEPVTKGQILTSMGFPGTDAVEKADVLAMGVDGNGEQHPFGVVHVKASFAERRTDDVPLSMKLIAANYASPLLTMDCKAGPSSEPVNRGELGRAQGGTSAVSSKRLDIEVHRAFDAVFSYNTNTIPTSPGTNAAARIIGCDFSDPKDAFSRHLIRKWKDRQGIN